MRHSHCSVLCIFYFIQISSNRRKLRHRYLFLSIDVAWRLASAHTCWFAIKRNAYMCLCVNHPMEERKNPRRKASVWKWVAAGSSLVNMAKWQKKGLSGDTFNKGKTKVQHLSPLCHLQAQAIVYTTYAAKHWTSTKNGLEKVPECWSPLPC